jgi:serine protease Do/serine protease DegQ
VKIDAVGLPSVRMTDSDNIRVGDVVFAIGNPLGLDQTVTMGIVSATGRSQLGLLGNQGYENFIQTDASINPGNSGGALIDAEGRLIGINTAIYSRTGGNIGIGFAIPINLARSIVVDLLESGTVQRGYLGVTISDLDPELAEAFGLTSTDGVIVESVQPGLAADAAGMQRGDIIVAIDGESVRSMNELRLLISQKKPGTQVALKVVRNGEPEKLTAVLGDLENPYASVYESGELLDGVTLEALSEENRREFGIGESAEGVVVTNVEGSSPYASTLRRGVVIREVNDQRVTSLADVRGALESGRVNKLWISYRGVPGYVALRLP